MLEKQTECWSAGFHVMGPLTDGQKRSVDRPQGQRRNADRESGSEEAELHLAARRQEASEVSRLLSHGVALVS